MLNNVLGKPSSGGNFSMTVLNAFIAKFSILIEYSVGCYKTGQQKSESRGRLVKLEGAEAVAVDGAGFYCPKLKANI